LLGSRFPQRAVAHRVLGRHRFDRRSAVIGAAVIERPAQWQCRGDNVSWFESTTDFRLFRCLLGQTVLNCLKDGCWVEKKIDWVHQNWVSVRGVKILKRELGEGFCIVLLMFL